MLAPAELDYHADGKFDNFDVQWLHRMRPFSSLVRAHLHCSVAVFPMHILY